MTTHPTMATTFVSESLALPELFRTWFENRTLIAVETFLERHDDHIQRCILNTDRIWIRGQNGKVQPFQIENLTGIRQHLAPEDATAFQIALLEWMVLPEIQKIQDLVKHWHPGAKAKDQDKDIYDLCLTLLSPHVLVIGSADMEDHLPKGDESLAYFRAWEDWDQNPGHNPKPTVKNPQNRHAFDGLGHVVVADKDDWMSGHGALRLRDHLIRCEQNLANIDPTYKSLRDAGLFGIDLVPKPQTPHM